MGRAARRRCLGGLWSLLWEAAEPVVLALRQRLFMCRGPGHGGAGAAADADADAEAAVRAAIEVVNNACGPTAFADAAAGAARVAIDDDGVAWLALGAETVRQSLLAAVSLGILAGDGGPSSSSPSSPSPSPSLSPSRAVVAASLLWEAALRSPAVGMPVVVLDAGQGVLTLSPAELEPRFVFAGAGGAFASAGGVFAGAGGAFAGAGRTEVRGGEVGGGQDQEAKLGSVAATLDTLAEAIARTRPLLAAAGPVLALGEAREEETRLARLRAAAAALTLELNALV